MREPSVKAKLPIYQSVYFPIPHIRPRAMDGDWKSEIADTCSGNELFPKGAGARTFTRGTEKIRYSSTLKRASSGCLLGTSWLRCSGCVLPGGGCNEITSLGWLGNACVPPEELARESEVWMSLFRPLSPQSK